MSWEHIEYTDDKMWAECPYCHSRETEGGFVEILESMAWQVCQCLECGKSWAEGYKAVYKEVER